MHTVRYRLVPPERLSPYGGGHIRLHATGVIPYIDQRLMDPIMPCVMNPPATEVLSKMTRLAVPLDEPSIRCRFFRVPDLPDGQLIAYDFDPVKGTVDVLLLADTVKQDVIPVLDHAGEMLFRHYTL